MENQMVTKWSKAVLALAAALGIGLEPEHIEMITTGAAGCYAVITAVEAWVRQRKTKG